ncbi:MAG: rane protein, partial [Mycobacterium sp.]|nr:rane protein [Mycobacterium sp.]
MFWSMAPLVLGCILLAGMLGMCSFQPNGPAQGTIPTYEATSALRSDAETLGFPVRMPVLPEGWQANSGRRDGIDAGRTDPTTRQQVRALISNVGYLTPDTRYLSLTQSDADEEKLVGYLLPGAYPTGSVDVGGRQWVTYQE